MKTSIFKVIVIFLFFSSFSLAQWTQMNGIFSGRCFNKSGRYNLAGSTFTGVFYSTNYGTNWTWAQLENFTTKGLAVIGKYVFAGTDHTGVFYADTVNWSWVHINNGIPSSSIRTLAVNGSNIFASVQGGVYLSADTGSSWIAVNNGFTNLNILGFAVDGDRVFAGTPAGLFVTTNNGSLWTLIDNGLSTPWIRAIVVTGNEIFVGTRDSGVYYSSNNGLSWTARNNGLPGINIAALARSGNNLFAGIDFQGVFYSSNLGQSWVPKNEGLVTGGYSYALFITDGYIFLGVSNGAWRRQLSEITAVEGNNTNVPSVFQLYQNYPNPFNPKSKIKYDIAKLGNVRLVIYDVLGREVTTLVNEQLKPGSYEVEWDAGNYPSGVYFYKLVTDAFVETKKMVLIK